MHSRVGNLLINRNYVDGAAGVSHHFSDTGLFGMTIEGPGSHSQELMSTVVETLNGLKDHIGDAELHRAKNQLKMEVLTNMENTESRLEEAARNFMTFGDLTF